MMGINWEIIGWSIGFLIVALVGLAIADVDLRGKLEIFFPVFGEGVVEGDIEDSADDSSSSGGSEGEGEGEGAGEDVGEGEIVEGELGANEVAGVGEEDSDFDFEVNVELDSSGSSRESSVSEKKQLLDDAGILFNHDLCGEGTVENCIDLGEVDDDAITGLILLKGIYGGDILIDSVSSFSGAVFILTGEPVNTVVKTNENLGSGNLGDVGSIYVLMGIIFRLEENLETYTRWRVDFNGEDI
jgi:hypothetical protein